MSAHAHVGQAYHEHILAAPPAVRLRAAFQALACERLPAGCTLLDFGAGTGIDAAFFSARGHRVHVYEPDPSQLAHLERHCAPEIASGAVHVEREIPGAGCFDALIADLAVLNLVDHRAPLFRDLHAMLTPGAPVLLSLLNPWHGVALVRRSSWKHGARVAVRGQVRIEGPGQQTWRFTPGLLARDAAPGFRLVRAAPATGDWRTGDFYFAELERL